MRGAIHVLRKTVFAGVKLFASGVPGNGTGLNQKILFYSESILQKKNISCKFVKTNTGIIMLKEGV